MYKLLVLLVMMGVSANAFANERWLCLNEEDQDATLTANFSHVETEAPTIFLFVPTSETDGTNHKSLCTHDSSSMKLSVSCNVLTTSDSGYEVKLISTNGTEAVAHVTPWTMRGKGKTTVLPCIQ